MPGAERSSSSAEHEHADSFTPAQFLDVSAQFIEHRRDQRVELLGAVQRKGGDAAIHVAVDQRRCHVGWVLSKVVDGPGGQIVALSMTKR